MNIMPNSLILKGQRIILSPYEPAHFDVLFSMAQDPRIWQHYALNGADEYTLKQSFVKGLEERELGIQYPFIISLQATGKIVGSTRLLDIQPVHCKLEIGFTWLHPTYWGTGVNTECKLLLLTYCFEQWKARRVQLKTDENNHRSRKAIQKIGGRFEGILRNDMVRQNGTSRHSAYYSILDVEWPETKISLQNRLFIHSPK